MASTRMTSTRSIGASAERGVVAQLGDKRTAIVVEGADLVFDLVREPVHRDEEGELAVAQGVEDLPVVATRPHRFAVGDEAESGDVFAGTHQLRDRAPDPAHGQAGVEE